MDTLIKVFIISFCLTSFAFAEKKSNEEKNVHVLMPKSSLQATKEVIVGADRGYDGSQCASGVAYLQSSKDSLLIFSTSAKYLKELHKPFVRALDSSKQSIKNLEEFANSIASVYCDDAGYFPIKEITGIVDSRFDHLIGLVASHGQDVGGPPNLLILARKGTDYYELKKWTPEFLKNAKCSEGCNETDRECKQRDKCYANYILSPDGQKYVKKYATEFLTQVEFK